MKRLLAAFLLLASPAYAANAPVFTQPSPSGAITMWNGSTYVSPLVALGAAARGANSDLTSLSGLTTPLSTAQGGTGTTTSTGTGNLVLSNSPTLVTPALGTPSSATLTNATGLPLSTGVTGLLPPVNGGCGIASLSGLLKGNGASPCTAAVAGTDFLGATPGSVLGANLAYDAPPACQSLTAFGGKADGTTDNLAAWNAAISALSIRTNMCIALPPGTSMFSGQATVTLTGSQTITVEGGGRETSEAWFPNLNNGFVVNYTAGTSSYVSGNAMVLRDLAVTTSQIGGGTYAWYVNGNSSAGVTMKQTDGQNIAFRGHTTSAFWSNDMYFENVQNVHLSSYFVNGCQSCGTAASGALSGGTAITYDSAGTNSRATQFQATDGFIGAVALGINVTGSPQGVTVANLNLSGAYNGITFALNPTEAVCNLNNVQINAANQDISITDCLQGSITSGTFYQGAFGTPSGNGISEIICLNCHYMTFVGNNFFGVTNGGFTPNGITLSTGTGASDSNVVANSVFNGTTSSVILGSGTSHTTVIGNRSVTGVPVVDNSGNTTNAFFDETAGIALGALSISNGQITEGRLGAAGNPSFVSCGTGPVWSVGANDTHGSFTTGTSATVCTFNWLTTRVNSPDCVVTPSGGGAQPSGGVSNGGASYTVSASTKYTYVCFGQ